jgi:hypothetical protein
MITSGIVGAVIGVIFIFFVFSLIVSGITEAITRALEWRSRHLWRALRQLMDGEGNELTKDPRPSPSTAESIDITDATKPWAERIYAHPLIIQLEGRLLSDRSRLSRIPANDFARTLVDLLVPDGNGATTVDNVREGVRNLDDDNPLKKPLLSILAEASSEMDKAVKGIGDWFDARMEALSRRYKTHVKWALLCVGLVVAVAFNVDALGAGQRLYRDDALRAAISQQASSIVQSCENEADPSACAREGVQEIDPAIRLPVGWPDDNGVDATQILGWLITGIALGQGAPFWFDLLRKARRFGA